MRSGKSCLNKFSASLFLTLLTPTVHAIKPSDPLYESSINLGPGILPIYYQWSMPAMGLEPAWDLARGHAALGLLDTGIQVNHPDLIGNFRPQFSYDFGSGDDDVDERETSTSNVLGRGHGTHVAGIMAAVSNNNVGTAGICWHCSLMVAKRSGTNYSVNVDVEGINWLVSNGAQVINMSFGNTVGDFLVQDTNTCETLPAGYSQSNDVDERNAAGFCDALNRADEYDVVIVAASGNGVRTATNVIHYPASDPNVIAVGAMDINGSATPTLSSIAIDKEFLVGDIAFNHSPEKDFVAPGFNVLSTFYKDGTVRDVGESGYDNFHVECADYIDQTTQDTPPLGVTGSNARPTGDGYGPCSGTSMAAPHVSGLIGILRSVNPLLNKDQIKNVLIRSASQNSNRDDVYGYGLPNAEISVRDVLGVSNGQQLVNRLTPLFSLYSHNGEDYFYTTKPQSAMAALYGELQPQPDLWTVNWRSIGGNVPGYNSFPKPGFWWTENPLASVYIFTTHNDPTNPGRELTPLYRLSYQGLNPSTGNQENVDHVYAVSQAEVDAYIRLDYQLDGIEGYIYSRNQAQPEGTVRLYRKYNQAKDDHAIFPETELSSMVGNEYNQNSLDEWIGYVYLNQDSDSDGLIDGFERIIGTDINNPDSDFDGVSDGVEVNNYPYSDPRDFVPNLVAAETILKTSQPHWLQVSFSDQLAGSSLLFAQMQTFNGSDTAGMRMRNLSQAGVELFLEEERSRDTEIGHTNEDVGLLGLGEGEILDASGNIVGEAGSVSSNTTNGANWRTLTFSRTYANPVLLMGMMTYNGGHPSHLRLRNVSSSSAQYQIEEWDYLDGGHTTENIAYIVVEQGAHVLVNGTTIQAGITTRNHAWGSVNFDNMGSLPVVFSQSQTYNGGQAIVTRHRNITSSSFQLRLQEEEGNDGGHANETVGYIVVQ